MEKKKYDSTVARIAGNILSGHRRTANRIDADGLLDDADKRLSRWAVNFARAIVAEVERTEPDVPFSAGDKAKNETTKG